MPRVVVGAVGGSPATRAGWGMAGAATCVVPWRARLPRYPPGPVTGDGGLTTGAGGSVYCGGGWYATPPWMGLAVAAWTLFTAVCAD